MTTTPDRFAAARRLLRRHRRLVSATALAAAVMAALLALAPAPTPTRPVVVAAGDIPAGTMLAASHLRVAQLPAAAIAPKSASDSARLIGRTTAGAIGSDEQITASRLADLPPLAAHLSATTVRITDPTSLVEVAVGDQVDVIAADSKQASVVAEGVEVRKTVRDDDGALIVVATTREQTLAIAKASTGRMLSVTVR